MGAMVPIKRIARARRLLEQQIPPNAQPTLGTSAGFTQQLAFPTVLKDVADRSG
jgi:hypothetical protein